ncbi:MAG: hypothetical protein H6936_04715 [Burkholderiales bacterium]|nr:hypothetical protein [Nitrosomonas sp.]MCP5274146.1 hypothetical protein [Burkholderiales bacterium]
MKQHIFTIVVFLTVAFCSTLYAAADEFPCGENCQVNYTTAQDIEEAINDFLGNQLSATVTRNAETGVFTVTFSDGRVLSTISVGLTLRAQNMLQQRHMGETEDGQLRLRSRSGLQIQLRNAFHDEPAAIGAMLRERWRNMEWFRNRLEIESPSGERMCLEPAMEIIPGQPSADTTLATDENGRLFVRYRDGFQQHLQACAHDMIQLRDQVRTLLREQLQLHTDGTISVRVAGQLLRYRLEATLRWSNILDHPGFFMEQNRLYFRYRDGWEQELVPLS